MGEMKFNLLQRIMLYISILNPSQGDIELSSLGLKSLYKPKKNQSIKMIGSDKDIKFSQTDDKLSIMVPAKRPNK